MIRLSAAFCLCTVAACAQQAGPLFLIDAAVVDASGHPVTGLTAADFEIAVEGKTVQPARLTAFDTLRHTAVTPTSLPAVELTPDQIHRTTVIVVDDLCLSPDAMRDARAQLFHFVNDLLAPGDLAAILRTSGGSSRERAVTGDRRHLLGIVRSTESADAGIAPQSCAAAAWITVAQALEGLTTFTGRKAVVLLSSPLRSPIGKAITEIPRLAALSMTAVYPLAATAPELAAATGGAPGGNLDRVIAETAGYYVLSVPGIAAGAAPQVTVSRPGATLRVRNQPAGPPPVIRVPGAPTSDDARAAAMNSPFQGSGIGLQITPMLNSTTADGDVIDILCHIDARDLGYLHDEHGIYHLTFAVGVASVMEGGRVTQAYVREHVLDLTEAEYQKVREAGIVVTRRDAWNAGARDLRIMVADQRTGRIGTASAFGQVHRLASGDFFLSGVSLKGGDTVRESASVRSFRSGAKVTFIYNIFNATVDSDGTSRLETRSQLSVDGREVFTGTPIPVSFERSGDPRRRQVAGRFELNPSTGPGRYMLHVTVTDLLSPKPRTASQFIDFTVEP